MILLGLILLIVGVVMGIPTLETIGALIGVIGLVLFILGRSGRVIGGRRYWY